MQKEKLLQEGFNEEQANKILELHRAVIRNTFIPKHRFDEINEELKSTKDQLQERDNQIASLRKFEGDSQALQQRIKELEDDNKNKDQEYASKLVFEKKKNAVRLALLEDEGGKPFDSDMVMGLFDLEKINLDENTGKITSGYQEQNESIRKEKAFLFEPITNPDLNIAGMKVKGNPIKDGDPGKPLDTSESYGKSLAAIKLSMMGINSNEE